MRDMELGPRSSQLSSRATSPLQDRWFTLLLASVASIACLQVRIEPSQWKSWLLSEWICVLIVAGILRWLCLRGPHHATTWYRTGLAGLAIMAPWISQVVQWSLQWPYEANELVWMNLFQNATLILAAIAHSSRQSWTSLLMACFSTLFCLATSDRMEILITASIFGILVMWWLMVRHWEQLDPGLTATDAIPLFRLRVSAVILILMLAGSAAILAHRSGIEAYALQGFMPTSGGNQGADESARNGVGDGSMLVAAKDNATTFGPVESDLFLESQLPTLYDLATDVFGEPATKKQKMQQAVAIQATVQEAKKDTRESKSSSKEFSTVRSQLARDKTRTTTSIESRALFFLQGKTPLHLRFETYDHFDGSAWRSTLSESSQESISLESHYGKPWIRCGRPSMRWTHSLIEPLAIKLIGYRSSRIPTPAQATHVHIDRIDRPDFFGWTPDQQLCMTNRDYIPSMTVVRQQYVLPKLHAFRSESKEDSSVQSPDENPWLQVPSDFTWLKEEATRRAGVAGIDHWRGIESIVRSLQEDFQYDPNVRVPQSASNSVRYLFDNKSGPDYLFASSAAMLLRSIHVPCRMVMGFYVSPSDYNYRSGQSEVYAKNMHTWIEVYRHGLWVPLEATPGFEAPLEYRTWLQCGLEFLWSCSDSIRTHPIPYAAIALGFIGLTLTRKRWIEGLMLSLCMIAGRGASIRRLRWTLFLLRWRAHWIDRIQYPRGVTIAKQLDRQLASITSLDHERRYLLVSAAQHLHYAPVSDLEAWIQTHRPAIEQACVIILRERWNHCLRCFPSISPKL